MKKTLEEFLSEHLALEEGKPLQKCARFFGFLAVYMLLVIIGFWFCESYVAEYGFQGNYITYILFKFVARAVVMLPVAVILSRCYRSFKKEEAYVSCHLLKITGFSVILCILMFSFTGTIHDLSAVLSLIVCSAVCTFIYSVFLDSSFLRRGALIYCIVSMACFVANIFVFYEIYISIRADSDAVIKLNEIFEWTSFMIIALAVAFGYLITMIGILRKNKELARDKENNIIKVDEL